MNSRRMHCGTAPGLAALAALITGSATIARAAEPAARLGARDIAGQVTTAAGPEAGVWVIAETDDLKTRYAKIVVTDEQGRYLVPDLPAARYRVWVRGYGLTDSAPIAAKRGEVVDIPVTAASDAATAARVYPAAYWYALMTIPDVAELQSLPGGRNEYLMWVKNMGCVGCHQLGNLATRTIPAAFRGSGSAQAAWTRRIQSGQAGSTMVRLAMGTLGGVPIKYLADWSERIAAGELPQSAPPRPAGIERNVVATVRDWSDPKAYLHDLSGTDRRQPTVNAHGPLYGTAELSTDEFPVLDPEHNVATTFHAPVRDADTPSTHDDPVIAPSAYWGDEPIWNSRANAHNSMLDQLGRVWYTARIRGPANPSFCTPGSAHPSAQRFPTERSERQLAVYEPRSGKYSFIDTCFSTHHLQFAADADNTLWTSGGREVIGWLDTKTYDRTGDAAASQHWAPLVLDSNGNGRLDDWVEPGEAAKPGRDTRLGTGIYAVMPNPADGSVWGSVAFRYPGAIVRFDPKTLLTELYNVPLPGFGVRGADIDRDGVVWVSLGSGHLGRFDRRLCHGPLNGPTATGDHCPEGWRFYDLPGPGFKNLPQFSVESSYYTWVDQYNTSGLGENVPIATGNLFDGLHALVQGKFVTLRIPYPLGFYAKGIDGRIDDPNGGWKGRGLWVTSGDRTPWLKEGGQGSKPLVVQFQVRPNPLAR
jgi:hypothetical protein